MNILLLDIDSKIPNIALMKLSTYHKLQGDKVELITLNYTGYREGKKIKIQKEFDKIYSSIIFTSNKEVGIGETGGSGYDLVKTLPKEIDDLDEDYTIYPNTEKRYGFITRGCKRKCEFCFVPKKEGGIYLYREPERIVKENRIYEFLDNNILSYNQHKDILLWLVINKVRYNFNQGLDIRLIDDYNSYLLSKSRYIGEYIFAFDDIKLEHLINSKLHLYRKYMKKEWKIKFFILVGFNSEPEEDIYRVEWCRANQVLPYIMRHENYNKELKPFYTNLAAYCNQPHLFKSMSPTEFINKRLVSESSKKLFLKYYN